MLLQPDRRFRDEYVCEARSDVGIIQAPGLELQVLAIDRILSSTSTAVAIVDSMDALQSSEWLLFSMQERHFSLHADALIDSYLTRRGRLARLEFLLRTGCPFPSLFRRYSIPEHSQCFQLFAA